MLYNKDWCKLEYLTGKININHEVSEDEVDNILKTSMDDIKRKAVISAASVVGNNPVICLSGGIDSQTLLHIWKEQNIPYTAVTFDFGNGFNSQELSEAQRYAEFLNVPLKIIKLDVMRFLLHDLKEFATTYNLLSPQFAVHSYFLSTIEKLGYTGAVFGGNGLLLTDKDLDFRVSDAQLLDLENYSIKSNFPVIPSFLSFDKDLCTLLALSTPIIEYKEDAENRFNNIEMDLVTRSLKKIVDVSIADRYDSKIKSYRNLKCQIIPQECKKTGFEEIKNYYNSLNDSLLAFDRDFRTPLRFKRAEPVVETIINPDVSKLILKLSKELNS